MTAMVPSFRSSTLWLMVHKSERPAEQADLAILVLSTGRAIADRLQTVVHEAGYPEMRPQYGFVIRALWAGGKTLTDLSALLAVSKQAAIKVVDEMEAHDILRREPHPTDRRAKVLVLTDRGKAIRRTALRESHKMERELRRACGDDAVDAMRHVLLEFGERHGVGGDAPAGYARPLW
jgi:DNA-binding MarR family transcriptional regulator